MTIAPQAKANEVARLTALLAEWKSEMELLTSITSQMPGVEQALRGNLSVDACDHNGWTLLFKAAVTGDQAVVALLLQRGASVNLADHQQQTPLMAAVRHGHMLVAQTLLRTPGVRIEAADKDGRTALLTAVIAGRLGLTDMLINAGADVAASDRLGWTALHYAVDQAGTVGASLTDRLLQAGADANRCVLLRDPTGTEQTEDASVLLHAASVGHAEATKLLLANERVNTSDGRVLVTAAANGHANVLQVSSNLDRDKKK